MASSIRFAKIGLLLAVAGVPCLALAYPNFIGFGYTSCLNCHYNPGGNGPLTDYGRALGATVIAAKPFFDKRATDEQLGQQSGFLGTHPLPAWISLAADYRGLQIFDDIGGSSAPAGSSRSRWIHMQAEGSLVLKTLRDRLFGSATLGYVPVPRTVPPAERSLISTWISREHYVGFRPHKSFGVYAGFMDQTFGLRVPDHNAYIRSNLQLNVFSPRFCPLVISWRKCPLNGSSGSLIS